MHALGVVEDEVRELVRRRGLDPEVDGGAIRRLIDDVLADYDERSLTSSLPPVSDPGHAARFLYDATTLYVAIYAYDSEPDKIIATVRARVSL